MFITNPEIAAEVQAIARLLRSVSIGETLSYTALSDAIGRDVQRDGRISLMNARRTVEREDGSRFGTVRRVGIKRLAAEEIPGIGTEGRRRAHRAVKMAYNRLSGVKANDITPETEKRITAERAHLGAIALVTQESKHTAIQDAVVTVGAEIPAAKVLGLFVK